MRIKYILFMISILLIVSGCEKDRVYRGIYEGLKHREEIVNPPNESTIQEQPGYDEYKREREELLKKDNEEYQ